MRNAAIILVSLLFLGSCGKKKTKAPVHAADKEIVVDEKVPPKAPKNIPGPVRPVARPTVPVVPAVPVDPPPVAPVVGGGDILVPPAGGGIAPLPLPFWGPNFSLITKVVRPEKRHHDSKDDELDWLLHWNEVAIDASGTDHAEAREQMGPGRSSRAIAMVQIAVFEAVNAIEGGYKSYTKLKSAKGDVSVKAAIAQAAHDTLVNLFPAQKDSLDEELADQLDKLKDTDAKDDGILLGKAAAKSILKLRKNDGSEKPEPTIGTGPGQYDPPVGPGLWSQDPISLIPVALGAFWSEVKPFVMTSAHQFRVPPPPALTSQAYTSAFKEDVKVGGDGVITPTERTPTETDIGIYWAYDGTPSLCAPPRLYNQITTHIIKQEGTGFVEAARLLALMNIAMADAGIGGWESKYFYNFWRPVTAIRNADTDGNPDTDEDDTFSPLGAPASNLNGPNFTPPFPGYPSGHATFGGAIFQILRKFYQRDNIAFTFTSDELDGKTKDNEGNVRPLKPRSFSSLSQAEEENGQSRMYLGIHWAFDKNAGVEQGRKIADLVFDKVYLPTN